MQVEKLVKRLFLLAGCSAITPEEKKHETLSIPQLNPPCVPADSPELADGNI